MKATSLRAFLTARESTVDAAFRECLRLLAYISTPRTRGVKAPVKGRFTRDPDRLHTPSMLRALCRAQSRPYTGTLTRLNSERTARKIFKVRWDKSRVYKKSGNSMLWDFRFILFIRAKRVYFNLFLAKQKDFSVSVIGEANTD